MKKIGLIIAGLVGVIALVAMMVMGSYNGLVSKDESGNNIYNLERELDAMKERDIYIVDVTHIQQKIGSNPIGINQDEVYMI